MSARDHGWIVVERWEDFQTYDTRRGSGPPPWIKVYTRLLDDENYLGLSSKRRAILHGIWLLYAASGCKLSASPARLGARLGIWTGTSEDLDGTSRGRSGVRRQDLVALEQAGFIRIVAREMSATESASEALSRMREEVEEKREEPSAEQSRSDTTPGSAAETFTSDTEYEEVDAGERELVRFSDDDSLEPIADTIQRMREKWAETA